MARISLDPPKTLSYRIATRFARRRYGVMLDPGAAMGHNMQVAARTRSSNCSVERWRTLDRGLKDLAVMAAAARIGCAWCLDFGYWEATMNHDVPAEKIRAVPDWRDSDVFTELERLVLEYAEAMTDTPPSVTDEMVARLSAHLSEARTGGTHRDRGRGEPAVADQLRARADRAGLQGPVCEIRPPAGAGRRCRRAAARVTDARCSRRTADLMFAIAYRMLGTIADAEDAVQDAWLRWSAASRADVADPRAYLARVVTNTALNRLRSARARREAYVGPWLPEPLLTEAGPDAAERAELAESVSVAMLVVLESLTPEERAVFVLREVFGFGYAEIGAALGRRAARCGSSRTGRGEHVQARRPRFDVDWDQQREVTERFLAAAVGGDIDGLMTVLAPDVTLLTDGGGLARASRRSRAHFRSVVLSYECRAATWCDRRSCLTVGVLVVCWGLGWPSLRVSARIRRCLMATTTPSAALVPTAPVFTNTERLALAGFLAGYSGLTRQAYELDLRQFASWCQQHQLRLFQARRADIECFARDLEARGRARATITRRLCTDRRVLPLRRRRRTPRSLTRRPRPPAPPGLRVARHRRWTATSSARCWSPPGSARPPSTR